MNESIDRSIDPQGIGNDYVLRKLRSMVRIAGKPASLLLRARDSEDQISYVVVAWFLVP